MSPFSIELLFTVIGLKLVVLEPDLITKCSADAGPQRVKIYFMKRPNIGITWYTLYNH